MKLYRYIEVSLYRETRYNDIAVKSPKISLYRGKIKMYFYTAYYLINAATAPELTKMFSVLKKCQGKLDCLVHEMLLIRERKPKLNTQSDSLRAKIFI